MSLVSLGVVVFLAGMTYSALLSYDPFRTVRDDDLSQSLFFATSTASPGVILAMAAILLVFRARRMPAAEASAAPGMAAALLASAALWAVWAQLAAAPRVLSLSLSGAVLGSALLLLGRAGWQLAWPSALLVLLAAPLPGVLIQIGMLPLQLATADLTAWILSLSGFPASAIGDAIYTPERTYQVIEACSGLRGMQTLTLAAFFVYLGPLHRSPRHTLALIACAPCIAFLGNLARSVSIVMIGSPDLSDAHELQGWTMFAAGSVGLALLDRISHARWRGASAATEGPAWPAVRDPRKAGWLAALFLVTASARMLPPWAAEPIQVPSIHDAVTRQLGPWTSEPMDVDRRFLGSVSFSERIGRRYRMPGHPGEVDFFAGIDLREQPELSLISPKTRLPGFGWWIEERSVAPLPDGGVAERILLRSPVGIQWLGYHWTEGTGSLLRETLRAWFALDRGPLRRSQPAVVARISTPVRDQLSDAESRLAAFLPEARQALARLQPPAGRKAS